MSKILTSHIYPPIPIRSFDWAACWADDEEGIIGWGATEEEAIAAMIAAAPKPEGGE